MTNSDGLERSQFNNGLERSQLLDSNSSSQTQMILKIHGFCQNVWFLPKSTVFIKMCSFHQNLYLCNTFAVLA